MLTGFLLSASVATPIVAKLGDLYGKGRVLTVVLILFSLGGVVCALATSIGVVIAGRVVQGVAGGVFPLAFGIVRDTFPPERVATGPGTISAIFGIGGGIGLPLSGVMVDNFDISWLFWISLIALPAAFAAQRLIPASAPVERTRIDWLGAGALGRAGGDPARRHRGEHVGLGLTAHARADRGRPGRAGHLGPHRGEEPDPLIDLGIFSQRAVATTNLTASATEAGLLLFPAAIAQLIAGPSAGRLGAVIGFRTTLAMGAGFATLAFAVLTLQHQHEWDFVLAGVLLGAGISFAFASMANLIVGAVPQTQVGIATGINTVMRTVGGAFGAAVATAILLGNTIGNSPIPSEGAYTVAFLMSACGGLLALGAALLVPTRAAEAAAAGATVEASPSSA